MLISRRTRYRWLPCVAFAVLAACGSSREAIPADPPRAAAKPEVVKTLAATPPMTDPAAAARLERVRQSLEQGLDANEADRDGRTGIMLAAFDGYTEVVELLLEYGAEVDRCDSAGRTALMYASSGPFPKTVELLIEKGADINRADTTEGWTALMVAAAEGHQPVVKVLLRHGADIALTDQDGDSAIDHARERKQPDMVALLAAWPREQ